MNIDDNNIENINNKIDSNDDNNENDDDNKNKEHVNNKNMNGINIRSSLHLNSFENDIFYNMVSLGQIGRIPKSLELIFIFIESVQLNILLYNEYLIPNLSDKLKIIVSICLIKTNTNPMDNLITIGSGIILLYVLLISNIILRVIFARKLPYYLIKINSFIINLYYRLYFISNIFEFLKFFDCSHDKNDTNAIFICYSDHHAKCFIISIILLILYQFFAYLVSFYSQNNIPLSGDFKSLISNNFIICYRRIVFIQILNIMLFKVYLNNKYISSIIMTLAYIFMFYKHLKTQYYYNSTINSFYSGLYFSMTCQSLIYLIFSFANILNLYPVIFVFNIIGFIVGWIINNYYYKWYSNKIFDKIENKYNTQHVITRLKEEIEFDNINDEQKSLDVIVSEKRVIKKENVYNNPTDSAIISKFITYNRSIEAFYLINSFFKEGISQFNRTLDVYIQFWNYLHGIQMFINLNKRFYISSDFDELNEKINDISEKILYKCASLSNTIFEKYLVYSATLIYDTDQPLLNSSSKDGSLNYELMELKHRSVQYHIASLNLQKNLMESFKILDNNEDIERAMIINDELTNFLTKAENFYNSYLIKGNFSRESLELYILFLRNSMNRSDLAEQYIQLLESNKEYENKNKSTKINDNNYEKSEIMSSSINSESISRKSKALKNEMLRRCQEPLYKLLNLIHILTTLAVIIGAIGNFIYKNSFEEVISNLDYFSVAAQIPVVSNEIKKMIRYISLMTFAGYNPFKTGYIGNLIGNMNYIGYQYLPVIYKIQSINPIGSITTHPIDNEVVDRLIDINYYKVAMKIYRKVNIIVDKVSVNNPDISDFKFIYDKDVKFFVDNSKGQFGDLFLNALDMTKDRIEREVTTNEIIFYIISAISIIFMIYMILRIIPFTNKSYLFTKNIISLYKTLPSKCFNDKMNEITDQIDDICENYDVEDSSLEKKNKTKKKSTTKNQKLLFIIYCGIITVVIIVPFATITLFDTECKNLMDFLVHSTRRGYYTYSVNIRATELIINDDYYYSAGEQLRLLQERYDQLVKLESELKEGKYGGKSGSDYKIFEKLYNNPGCVRFSLIEERCALREFKNFYTENIANSPIDYLMVEHLSRLNEFINIAEKQNCNFTVKEEVNQLLTYIFDNPYIEVLSKLSNDIVGHVDKMNELGSDYLIKKAKKYLKWTLILHALEPFFIFIFFYIFISRPIKHQLRLMDNITNITFSIPPSIYNTSPKLTKFIEHGKLE